MNEYSMSSFVEELREYRRAKANTLDLMSRVKEACKEAIDNASLVAKMSVTRDEWITAKDAVEQLGIPVDCCEISTGIHEDDRGKSCIGYLMIDIDRLLG